MAVNKDFKDLVEKCMYLLKIKQKDLAPLLDISPSYLTDIKNGKKTASNELIEKLSKIASEAETNKSETEVTPYIPKANKENEKEAATMVLLLPVSAQGGSLNDFVVSVKDSDCEKVVSPIRGVDFAMQVSGDSMSPEYPNGSRVFIKRINERAFIEWGKAYVLDTCNGTIIKTLVPSEQKGFVKCVSINQDPIYAPFEVSLQDVYGVYKVLLCMSVK